MNRMLTAVVFFAVLSVSALESRGQVGSKLPESSQMGMGAWGMSYYGAGYMGMLPDAQIRPMPSGKAAENNIVLSQHEIDSIAAANEALRIRRLELRELERGVRVADRIAVDLRGAALEKHNREYSDPYQRSIERVSTEIEGLIGDRKDQLDQQYDRFLNQLSSAGYIVMTPEERTKSQADGFQCGEGEQNVKRFGMGTEYACLNSEGYLTKSALLDAEGKPANVSTYVREGGKLVRVVTENDGAKVNEITYDAQKNSLLKMFGKDGTAISQCSIDKGAAKYWSADCTDCDRKTPRATAPVRRVRN